jgi:hypothetical protein
VTRRLAVTTVLVAAAASACGTEVSSNPAPTLTSTTTTTLAPTTTTTTTAATTTSTTTSTTTTAPTRPPGVPTDRSFPLLVGGGEGGWLLVGSWQVDGWVADRPGLGAPGGPTVDVGSEYTAGNLTQRSTGPAGELVEACQDGRVGPALGVTVAAPEPPGDGYGAVALPVPDWPLTPRPVAATSSGPDSYRQLAVDRFAGEPVDASRGAIQQLVVTDLDGDGDDEALLAFEFVQPSAGPGTPGDLSAVVLVDTATRNASAVRRTFTDQRLRPGDALPDTERSRVIDVADYNGDGVAEVAVHSWYSEGARVTVYEYDGAVLTAVLDAGCGV